jgi:hypothetical protein
MSARDEISAISCQRPPERVWWVAGWVTSWYVRSRRRQLRAHGEPARRGMFGGKQGDR